MSSQNLVDKKGLDDKAMVAFCESFLVSKTNMNLIIQNQKYIYGVYLYVFVIYEGYMRKNIWYDMIWYDKEEKWC